MTGVQTCTLPISASADFAARWVPDGFTRDNALAAPIVNLDRNDNFQYRVLHTAFGDPQIVPPAQYFPTADQYFDAIRRGLAYGLVATIKAAPGLADGSLVDLSPHLQTDLPLYWQCWKYQSQLLTQFSETVVRRGRQLLV